MKTEDKMWKLSLSSDDGTTISWETPQWDVTASQLIDAFASLLIGQTYTYKTVVNAMREFVENAEATEL